MEEYIKPPISNDAVLSLLGDCFGGSASNLAAVDAGQIASTFSFNVGAKECFVQFNYGNMSQGYRTEVFFAHQFALKNVPVRKIVQQGEYEGLQYSISEKAIGRSLAELNREDFEKTLPEVMGCLARIASINLGGTGGFGWLDAKFNGSFPTWAAHLMQIRDEEPGCFYGEWHQLFETTFLDKDKFDKYFAKMERLLPKLPAIRKFVHGGFGYGNVLVHNQRVSAVLDWQDARYGDPLFDLAYMVFWREAPAATKSIEAYRSLANKETLSLGNFDARLACYKYYLGLDGMRFAAKTNNPSFYKLVLEKLEGVAP